MNWIKGKWFHYKWGDFTHAWYPTGVNRNLVKRVPVARSYEEMEWLVNQNKLRLAEDGRSEKQRASAAKAEQDALVAKPGYPMLSSYEESDAIGDLIPNKSAKKPKKK